MNSPDLAYLIARERQQELLEDAQASSGPALRELVGRLREAFRR
jgi:hypothetical protein